MKLTHTICVYLFCRPDYTPAYVGAGWKDWRYKRHINASHNEHLNNIFRKTNGDLPFIVLFDDLTREEALVFEKWMIAFFGREDLGRGPLVNRTDGGDGVIGRTGWRHSEATKEKMRNSARLLGPKSLAFRENLSRIRTGTPNLKLRGRPLTEECKKNLSKALRGRPNWTKGSFWWITPQGIRYRSVEPRSEHDKRSQGLCWWSTPDGKEYKAAAPRNSVDVRGRATRRKRSF